MTTVGVILMGIAVLGFAALAARYLLTPAPMVHHAAILSHDGIEETQGCERVLKSLYSVIGCTSLALTILIGALAFYAIPAGAGWARMIVLVVAGVMFWGGVVVPRHVERETGVRMPWRPSLGVLIFLVVGALLTMF